MNRNSQFNHTTITVPKSFLERLQKIAPHGPYHRFLSRLLDEYEQKRVQINSVKGAREAPNSELTCIKVGESDVG